MPLTLFRWSSLAASTRRSFPASRGKPARTTRPPYLVDFVLDRVLPWGGTDWDLKVFDPSCGSGIFLVKSFQRLIQRWKRANPDKSPTARTLKRLLERNLFGVDKDRRAIRVACFSLYRRDVRRDRTETLLDAGEVSPHA